MSCYPFIDSLLTLWYWYLIISHSCCSTPNMVFRQQNNYVYDIQLHRSQHHCKLISVPVIIYNNSYTITIVLQFWSNFPVQGQCLISAHPGVSFLWLTEHTRGVLRAWPQVLCLSGVRNFVLHFTEGYYKVALRGASPMCLVAAWAFKEPHFPEIECMLMGAYCHSVCRLLSMLECPRLLYCMLNFLQYVSEFKGRSHCKHSYMGFPICG